MSVVREGYVVLEHIGRGSRRRAKHEENVIKRLTNENQKPAETLWISAG
jgi:hypothetical protein